MVAVVLSVIEPKLNGPVSVQVTVWAADAYASVQPVCNGGVFTLLPENVTALPPLGEVTLGELMAATVLTRLTAPVTLLLPASGRRPMPC
jgi:hypothetical protein